MKLQKDISAQTLHNDYKKKPTLARVLRYGIEKLWAMMAALQVKLVFEYLPSRAEVATMYLDVSFGYRCK